MSSRSEKLQERLATFAADVDDLVNRLPRDVGGQNLARQLVKSSTSPFANYCEACEAESPADYVHKLKIGLKELRETRAWLIYAEKRSRGALDASGLKGECNELISIFVTCIKKARGGE
jgi:four helix bundle protein